MADRGIRALVDAIETGSRYTSWITRTSAPKTFGARWADLSMGSGIPRYNTYVGEALIAKQLISSGNSGINLGPEPSAGLSRYVWRQMLCTTSLSLVPASFHLCDYLLFYPLIDGDSTDLQTLDNTLTLPRYVGGEGVRAFMVVTSSQSTDSTMVMNYTNDQGTSRSMTVGVLSNTQLGAIVSEGDTSGNARSQAPFIPLQSGDKGIRSIESVQLTAPVSGFMALVLCYPLGAPLVLLETGVAHERTFVMEKLGMPKIEPGAYLNYIYLAGQGGQTTPLFGHLDFVWR